MIDDKVVKLLADVFGVPEEKIDDNTSIETLDEWDSVNHMNLVMALEEEFGLTLTDEEMVSITSAKFIEEAVRKNNG